MSDILNLEYFVYTYDISSKSVEKFNIFDHRKFTEEIKKELDSCDTKEEFAIKLKKHLFYYYNSKFEWEVAITCCVPHITIHELDRLFAEREKILNEHNREPYRLYVNPDVAKKIDVYSQVMLNWDIFVDYVWSHQ